ncbi:MAG: hypothetical protein IT350_16295 [Deltaproteobacteria bacterium]|nr:hypothetical protein [Deltaproteobacteria bacterium]
MRLSCAVMFMIALGLTADVAWADSRTFELRYRSAREIVDQVRALLGPDGAVVIDEATNTLVVRDQTAVLRDIEKLVARLDAAPTLWTVTVTHTDARVWFEGAKSVEFVDQGPWRVATIPKEDQATARVTSSAESAARTLRLRAGDPAVFAVGDGIRIDEVQGTWFGRHGFGLDLQMATARAELSVRVSGSGENRRLAITPRVAVDSPSGPVFRDLDGIDVPLAPGRRIAISIRSGDARDVWGPIGAGVEYAWMFTVLPENAP